MYPVKPGASPRRGSLTQIFAKYAYSWGADLVLGASWDTVGVPTCTNLSLLGHRRCFNWDIVGVPTCPNTISVPTCILSCRAPTYGIPRCPTTNIPKVLFYTAHETFDLHSRLDLGLINYHTFKLFGVRFHFSLVACLRCKCNLSIILLPLLQSSYCFHMCNIWCLYHSWQLSWSNGVA